MEFAVTQAKFIRYRANGIRGYTAKFIRYRANGIRGYAAKFIRYRANGIRGYTGKVHLRGLKKFILI
ncbi:MAG: hypothetical protein ACYT04_85490, partial [Nostoc sp.]